MLQLNITADGPAKSNFTYKWKKRGRNSFLNAAEGKDTFRITISSVVSSDSGSYYCIVANQWGSMATSIDATVTVLSKLYH